MLPKAIFSDDRLYRYMLTRTWDESKGYLTFIGVNPSTADENDNDPTIEQCIAIAKHWGFGGIIMLNLFAFRATDPKDMKKAVDPIGKENNRYLFETAKMSKVIVAAWGNHGKFRGKDLSVTEYLLEMQWLGYTRLVCLKRNKNGSPRHPLYLKVKDLKPIDYC